MNDFWADDEFQRDMRDRILVPEFYHKRQSGRFVLMDKGRFAEFVQRRAAVDTVVQSRDGSAVGIEEKIVRWKGYAYPNYCLETKSCTVQGHESEGWMCYGRADYLLYCFAQDGHRDLLCHLIDFQKLKAWFWPLEPTFKEFQMKTQNRTFGRQVPISRVRVEVGVVEFTLSEPVSA